jgi:hypothetical protein
VSCARTGCEQPVQVAVRTRDAGLRGIVTSVYYEPTGAPGGSEVLCADDASALLRDLIRTLGGVR